MKNHPFAVRLDDDQAAQVKQMADRFRVKEIDVIRWAIDALIAYVAKHHGQLHLPIDFDALWEKIIVSAPDENVRQHLVGLNEPPSVYADKKRKAQ